MMTLMHVYCVSINQGVATAFALSVPVNALCMRYYNTENRKQEFHKNAVDRHGELCENSEVANMTFFFPQNFIKLQLILAKLQKIKLPRDKTVGLQHRYWLGSGLKEQYSFIASRCYRNVPAGIVKLCKYKDKCAFKG